MQNFWAIFFKLKGSPEKLEYEVKWRFNAESEEFTQNSLRLIKAFQHFGKDYFGDGQGAASVVLDLPQNVKQNIASKDYTLIENDELLIVALGQNYVFVICNVEITSRVLENVEIPFEVDQILRGVLSGQGSILYANLMDHAQSRKEENEVDNLFRTIVKSLQPKCFTDFTIDDLVKDKRCSLSPLTLTELLLFHHHLRKYFRSTRIAKRQDPWALAINLDGNFTYLEYNIPHDIAILGGLLSALNAFCNHTFGAQPKIVVFGDCSTLNNLYFFNGKKNILVMNQPKHLLKDPYFQFLILKLTKDVREDIEEPIEKYLSLETINSFSTGLEGLSFEEILALHHQVATKGLTPEVLPLKLKDVKGIGNKRLKMLKKKNINSIEELINFNDDGKSNWLSKSIKNAIQEFEAKGGWKLQWRKKTEI